MTVTILINNALYTKVLISTYNFMLGEESEMYRVLNNNNKYGVKILY